MENETYKIVPPPNWANAPSTGGILTQVNHFDQNTKTGGEAALCYVNNIVMLASESGDSEYQRRVTKLLTPDAVQDAMSRDVFVRDNCKYLLHRVQVVRNGGFVDLINTIKISVFDHEDRSHVGIINGTRKINIIINDLRLGDILFFENTFETHYTNKQDLVHHMFYKRMLSIPSNARIKNFEFSIAIHNKRKSSLLLRECFFKDKNGDVLNGGDFLVSPGDFFTKRYLEFSGVTLTSGERPYVDITSKSDWTDISSVLCKVFEEVINGGAGFYQNTPSYKSDSSAKIRDCIEYVQDAIKYKFNSTDMFAHVPQSIEKTLQEASGDCKAKTVLLVGLLRHHGFTAYPVLVSTKYQYQFVIADPSPFLFNHVIVCVEYNGKQYFVDATQMNQKGLIEFRSGAPFEFYLPLLQGGTLQRMRRDFEVPLIEENYFVRLKNGKAQIEHRVIRRGAHADSARNLGTRHGLVDWVNNDIKHIYSALSLPNLVKKNPERLFKNVTSEIVSDDFNANELVTVVRGELDEPYDMSSAGRRIFRLYESMDNSELEEWNNFDIPYFHDIAASFQLNIEITTDRYIGNNKQDRSDVDSENDYFIFSNRKKYTKNSVIAAISYVPKKYDYVESDELGELRSTWRRLNNVGLGVGFVENSFTDKYLSNFRDMSWYRILWILCVVGYVLGILGNSNN